jgi:hypothetical protein
MPPQREKIINITNYSNTTGEQDSHDDDDPNYSNTTEEQDSHDDDNPNYSNTIEEQDSHDDDNPPEITHQRQEKRQDLELLANQDNVDANIEGLEAIQRHKEVQKKKVASGFSTSEANRQSMTRTLPYEKRRRPRAKAWA